MSFNYVSHQIPSMALYGFNGVCIQIVPTVFFEKDSEWTKMSWWRRTTSMHTDICAYGETTCGLNLFTGKKCNSFAQGKLQPEFTAFLQLVLSFSAKSEPLENKTRLWAQSDLESVLKFPCGNLQMISASTRQLVRRALF